MSRHSFLVTRVNEGPIEVEFDIVLVEYEELFFTGTKIKIRLNGRDEKHK